MGSIICSINSDKDLQGDRTLGGDTYTGSYTTEYEDFIGEEYLFGGTGLDRKDGNEITVAFNLTITSDTAELCWISHEDEFV